MIERSRVAFVALTCWSFWIPGLAAELPTSPWPMPAGAANLEWRRILMMDPPLPDDCPDPQHAVPPTPPLSSWHQERLFGAAGLGIERLDRFCVYTFDAESAVDVHAIAKLEAFIGAALAPGSWRLTPDRLVVVPLGGLLDDTVEPTLNALFRQLGGAAPPAVADENVRLSVIDTAPTRDIDLHLIEGQSVHGPTLVHFARTLLCTDQDGENERCRARITSRLALRYLEVDRTRGALSQPNDALGGYVGSLADLAIAIHDEVTAWEDATSDVHGLVINLSVGWSRLPGQADPDDVAADAVLGAIVDARCRRALVVAAAGNRFGGPSGGATGALLPAAWETLPFRPACDCLDGGEAPLACETPTHAIDGPLVYAVGGVDALGQPLENVRPGSQPPRVAYADHAWTTSHAQATTAAATLTGSSVAALTVSASAAALWHQFPGDTADQIMEKVQASGQLLLDDDGVPREADFCLGCDLTPQPVRLINACQAVAFACANEPAACPAPVTCDPGPLPGIDWAPFDGTAQVTSFLSLSFQSIGTRAICGSRTIWIEQPLDTTETVLCPARQFHSLDVTPWTGPQPADVMCPNCAASSDIMEAWELPGKSAMGHVTLRTEIAADAPDLRTPTITTDRGIYRLNETDWPCLKAGGRCVIHDLPHDGERPIGLAFTVGDQGDPCNPAAGACWSTSSTSVVVP